MNDIKNLEGKMSNMELQAKIDGMEVDPPEVDSVIGVDFGTKTPRSRKSDDDDDDDDDDADAGPEEESQVEESDDEPMQVLPRRQINFKFAAEEKLEDIDEQLFDDKINTARCAEIEHAIKQDKKELEGIREDEKEKAAQRRELRLMINNRIKQSTIKLNYIRSHKTANQQAVQAEQGRGMRMLRVELKRGVDDIKNKRIEGVCDGRGLNGRRCTKPADITAKGSQYCEKHYYDVLMKKVKKAKDD
jgi:hypothetical protein